jgi:hypothetical protein
VTDDRMRQEAFDPAKRSQIEAELREGEVHSLRPLGLTPDQRAVFDKDKPTDTPEAVSGFRARCALQCKDAPSVEDVRAEIARRRLR